MRAGFIGEPLCVTLLDGEAFDGRGLWQYVRPRSYFSAILGGTVTIEAGFLTDFCSVPRLPFLYWLFGDTEHDEGGLHDWLFHNHGVCDEQTANRVLLEAAKANGVRWWRRFGIYLGVVFGGRSSWEEDGRGNGHTVVDGRII